MQEQAEMAPTACSFPLESEKSYLSVKGNWAKGAGEDMEPKQQNTHLLYVAVPAFAS